MLGGGVVCIGTPWILPMVVALAGRRWIATSCGMTKVTAALASTSMGLRLEWLPLSLQLRPMAALLVRTRVATALAVAPRERT